MKDLVLFDLSGTLVHKASRKALPLMPLIVQKLLDKGKDVLILIGPEGDFSANEVKMASDNDFKIITLGKSRLRTETAALVACNTINLLNE